VKLFVDLGAHAAFIVAAYGMAALIVIALIGWVALDYRAQKRRLAKLEADGVTRRSDRTNEKTA
jgi:heme exporter protein D